MRSLVRASALALAVAAAACGPAPAGPRRGDPAPPFALSTPAGRNVRFPEEFRGRAVAVRFWAGWCRFCEPEMTALGPVVSRLEGEGLSYLAVNAGQSSDEVRAFAQRLGLSYPVLVDESAATARGWGVKALPTTVFVGRDGRIRRRLAGEADVATFERMARELLAEEGTR